MIFLLFFTPWGLIAAVALVVCTRRLSRRAVELRRASRKKGAHGILAQTDGFRVHEPIRVAFLHPDLGIGGAERLIVDAAMGLQGVERRPIPSSPNGTLLASSTNGLIGGIAAESPTFGASSSAGTSRAGSTCMNATNSLTSPTANSSRRSRSLGSATPTPPPQSPPTSAATLRSHRRFDVQVFTNYHDPRRAFGETVDGTLKPIIVVGDWIPRHIRNKGHVLFAIARMLWAGLFLVLRYQLAPSTAYDVIIIDQVAAVMPLLKLLAPSVPLYFYCHFPDQLCDPTRAVDLNTLIDEKAKKGRGGGADLGIGGGAATTEADTPAEQKKAAELEALEQRRQYSKLSPLQNARHAYRTLFDQVEVLSMRAADRVNYNSRFSLAVTLGVFPFLRETLNVSRDVLYPPIDVDKALACPPLPTVAAPKSNNSNKAAGSDGGTASPAASSTSSASPNASGSAPPPPPVVVDNNPKIDGFSDVREADFARFLASHRVLTSINRFERKKNIGLAVDAIAAYAHSIGYDGTNFHKNGRVNETNGRDGSAIPISAPLLAGGDEKSHLPLALVICGGYDPRLPENVEHHEELLQRCQEGGGTDAAGGIAASSPFFPITSVGEYEALVREEMARRGQRARKNGGDSADNSPMLSTASATASPLSPTSPSSPSSSSILRKIPVLFLRSCTSRAKYQLLEAASVVLYTPEREHFGIVPVEAMCFGVPVIAVNNGGPIESIGQGDINGFLRAPNAGDFAEALGKALDPTIAEDVSESAADRARSVFGLHAFAAKMASQLEELVGE